MYTEKELTRARNLAYLDEAEQRQTDAKRKKWLLLDLPLYKGRSK